MPDCLSGRHNELYRIVNAHAQLAPFGKTQQTYTYSEVRSVSKQWKEGFKHSEIIQVKFSVIISEPFLLFLLHDIIWYF